MLCKDVESRIAPLSKDSRVSSHVFCPPLLSNS